MGSEQDRDRIATGLAANSAQPAGAIEVDFETPLRPGALLVGKYRIEALIGSGGIGFVMSATNIGLDEQVALKFLRPEFLSSSEAVHRFTNEARLAAKIQHPNVARVLDIESSEEVGPFIVMELLVGRDLNQVLQQEGAIPVARAVDYVLEACAALSAAHARDIVHRDVKPDNLFLARQQQGPDIVKILDFGISKQTLPRADVAQSPAAYRTLTGLGSPSYMSPEQIRACPDIDARADVWSLGCVLYELLTARHAFDAPTLMQVCAVVLEQDPPALRRHAKEVPAALEAVIGRCLQKAPADRYANVEALAYALRPFSSLGASDDDSRVDPGIPTPRRIPIPTALLPDEAGPSSVGSAAPDSTAPFLIDTPTASSRAKPKHRPRVITLTARQAFACAAIAASFGVLAAGYRATRQAAARTGVRVGPLTAPATANRLEPVELASLPLSTEALPQQSPSRDRREPPKPRATQAPSPAPRVEYEATVPSALGGDQPLPTEADRAAAASMSSAAFPEDVQDPGTQEPTMPLTEPATPLLRPPATREIPRSEPTLRPVAPALPPKATRPTRLGPAVVGAVVRAHSREIRDCFERAQLDFENEKARVAIVATLDRDGHVVDARADLPAAQGRLGLCLTAATKRWAFPANTNGQPLTQYRLAFE